jgi:purine-nucleoside phosphorylase
VSIQELTAGDRYRVAVVLGSGLSALARGLTGAEPIPYSAIPDLPASSVEGHEGALYRGEVEGVPALVFAGRIHLYEGYTAREVIRPVELAVDAGCDTVLLTNAAGAIAMDLEIGGVCLLSDHINLTGANPLVGPHTGRRPRFLDLSQAYDPALRELARAVDPALREGVYAGVRGPSYETPAEVRMLAALGADLVGMSTVLEAIYARYLGASVLGISVVSNRAAGLTSEPLRHEEVTEAGRRASARLAALLRGLIRQLGRAAPKPQARRPAPGE